MFSLKINKLREGERQNNNVVHGDFCFLKKSIKTWNSFILAETFVFLMKLFFHLRKENLGKINQSDTE